MVIEDLFEQIHDLPVNCPPSYSWEDCGIGAYEYWGAPGFHEDWQPCVDEHTEFVLITALPRRLRYGKRWRKLKALIDFEIETVRHIYDFGGFTVETKLAWVWKLEGGLLTLTFTWEEI